MAKRVRADVTGRVQGVGFRYSTQAKARELGVQGWVKNLLDGSVQFEAEGEDAAVDALVEWAHQGPVSAWVSGVRVREVPARGAEADGGFAIAG
ncbi:acylphosphatase [Brachybacterium sp. JHP9]|uniref:Acylphosphatase n=1 Tax=Brachybacterium equifaecis TaxID=2910770 RepID=A0ABT0QXC6_9MICO|nr:acylphosphatase [Brachybacterium equifaecis]MCL6422327.1 acylphosphatase [Brachybacterium equifaecis]